MATFPNTAIAANSNNTLPVASSLQGAALDPTKIFVPVATNIPTFQGSPNYGVTHYRLSDLIDYIVATAQGR